jgi:hypothetical protein
MGSPAAWGGGGGGFPAYDGLPCFRSGGETTREMGRSHQRRDWKTAQGARLSPVKGVGASRAEAKWQLQAPSGVPAQGGRVRVVGGCCGRGESRREAADGGVVRSVEAKQRQRTEAGSDVWRGGEQSLEGLLQPERREDKVGFGGARGLWSGRQRGREVAGGHAAVARVQRQRPGAV